MSGAADPAAIHAAIASYYGEKIAAHGATARGVDWRDEASHAIRHRQFGRLLEDDRDATVADLGCGYGDYLAFLRASGHRGDYVGYDVSAEMIAAAERQHGEGSDRRWRLSAHPDEPADYVVASGIFNVRRAADEDAWEAYVEDTVRRMASVARRGFGFNVLTRWSDVERRRPDLYYADPARWLDHVAALYNRRVAILQDYGLYEFTLLCRLG